MGGSESDAAFNLCDCYFWNHQVGLIALKESMYESIPETSPSGTKSVRVFVMKEDVDDETTRKLHGLTCSLAMFWTELAGKAEYGQLVIKSVKLERRFIANRNEYVTDARIDGDSNGVFATSRRFPKGPAFNDDATGRPFYPFSPDEPPWVSS